MLGVLRDGPAEAEQWLTPLPGLAEAPDLVGRLQSMGLPVVLDMDLSGAAPSVLPSELGKPASGLELATYRILQESLTNVVRHAGLVSTAVTVKVSGNAVELEVRNATARMPDGRIPEPREPGRGIVGMRERALSVGGTFSAGPVPDGGFLVRAMLPLHDTVRTS